MGYIIVSKTMLRIYDECYIPIPMSHVMTTKLEANKFMLSRGMRRDCEVLPYSFFKALSPVHPGIKENRGS